MTKLLSKESTKFASWFNPGYENNADNGKKQMQRP